MVTGAATLGVIGVGDRTGLCATLAGAGALTLEQITERSGLQERYLREALAALAAAGIVLYRGRDETYELPEEHAACLADEASPYFMGGWTQIVPSILNAVPKVAAAARHGGGVAYAEFGRDMVEGIDRANSPGMRILLTRKWLPAMPDVLERLHAGIRVADVGCGSGTAAITIGTAFPNSTVTGFDPDASSIDRARGAVEKTTLANVSFEILGAESLPIDPGFDLVVSFDTIHDMVNPQAVLRRIREVLPLDGTYLMVEPAAGDTLEENLNPQGALAYAMSTLHCMTVSLAHGGAGLGAAMGSKTAEYMCRAAGFTRFRRLDIENPFNAFYEVRP
jgi:SAM-dependent methyltransferase